MERIQRIINNGVNLEGVNTTCSSSVNRYAGWEFHFLFSIYLDSEQRQYWDWVRWETYTFRGMPGCEYRHWEKSVLCLELGNPKEVTSPPP